MDHHHRQVQLAVFDSAPNSAKTADAGVNPPISRKVSTRRWECDTGALAKESDRVVKLDSNNWRETPLSTIYVSVTPDGPTHGEKRTGDSVADLLAETRL